MRPKIYPLSQGPCNARLFDLGGVVIDIDFNRVFAHWLPMSRLSLAELKRGARAAGLQAVHVRGPADVRAALRQLGCAV